MILSLIYVASGPPKTISGFGLHIDARRPGYSRFRIEKVPYGRPIAKTFAFICWMVFTAREVLSSPHVTISRTFTASSVDGIADTRLPATTDRPWLSPIAGYRRE
jgi:hypothetical protein